jgi:hypothetical protein
MADPETAPEPGDLPAAIAGELAPAG